MAASDEAEREGDAAPATNSRTPMAVYLVARISALRGYSNSWRGNSRASLSEDAVVHVAGGVGQAEIASRIAVRQLGVVQAQQRQHRRVEVVDVHPVLR